MEPARRARVPKRAEAVADVTRKTHRPDLRIKATGDPTAEPAGVAEGAGDKVLVRAVGNEPDHLTV